MTAWPDLGMAVPGIGLRLVPDFGRGFLDRLALLWPEIPGAVVTYTGPAAITARASGWVYTADLNNLVVEFTYDVKVDTLPGALPSLTLPKVEPYSSLLPRALEKALVAVERVGGGSERAIHRVGVLLTTHLASDSLPPGVDAFVGRIAATMGSSRVPKADVHVVAELATNGAERDVCHHVLSYDQTTGADLGVRLRLDWQRYYLEPQNSAASRTARMLESCVDAARSYMYAFGDEAP